MMTTSNLTIGLKPVSKVDFSLDSETVSDRLSDEIGKSLLELIMVLDDRSWSKPFSTYDVDTTMDEIVHDVIIQLVVQNLLKADEIFDHFTGLVEKKRRFLNQVILRKMNNLERSVKQLMALIRKGELTSEEFINLLSKDMVMVGFPTAVDQLVATKHSSAGGCGAELYCYKRRLKRFQKPAVISSPKDALSATFLELSTPPSKLRKHQEYLELADGFSACDLACFFKELLDGEVPDELKDAQHRMNLLFFDPEGFNKESQFRCNSKLAVAPPDNMRGLCPELKVENRPKCIFSNAVIEVAAVLADRGLIKRKSQLCRLFAPNLDTSYASRLHTNSKGYKLKYFDCEMQTLLDLMITAYMPNE